MATVDLHLNRQGTPPFSKESRENRTVGRSDRDNARVDRVPIAEAAERLGVSRDTLERLIRAGRLKRYRRFGQHGFATRPRSKESIGCARHLDAELRLQEVE